MKKNYHLSLLTLFILFSGACLNAQVDSGKTVVPPPVVLHNAGFDVIIKINGEIVYGLVKEVGLTLVSYQRTDIPDGPVYTMLRSEVHAISYRNQVKEYFTAEASVPTVIMPEEPGDLSTESPLTIRKRLYPKINYKNNPLLEQGSIRFGFGAIKTLTKVDDKENYISSGTFPAVNIGYDANYKNKARLGLQISFGSRNFSKQDYSGYDSIQNNIAVKENIFALYLYTKYDFLQSASRLKPYIIAGLGIVSSRIKSENTINFTTNNSQTIIVKSGTHSTGLGIIARAGGEYYVNDQFRVFLDVGAGMSLLNFGVAVNMK